MRLCTALAEGFRGAAWRFGALGTRGSFFVVLSMRTLFSGHSKQSVPSILIMSAQVYLEDVFDSVIDDRVVDSWAIL